MALEPQGVRQINGYFLHISSNKHTHCIPAGENKQVLKIQAHSIGPTPITVTLFLNTIDLSYNHFFAIKKVVLRP
jgi:hypothetical protein